MSMNHFAKAWDHHLKISDVWEGADDLPDASKTLAMGAEIVTRIKAMQARLKDTSDLFHDLDNCIEAFEELEGIDNDYEARDRFNSALGKLYDEADYAKRIWVE